MPSLSRSAELRRSVMGGTIAGAIAGIVMTLFMLVMATAQGHDVWSTLKGPAAAFMGERAAAPGFDGSVVALGFVIHMATSMFGPLVIGLSRAETVVAGVPFGLMVWLGMYYLVLPLAGMGHMALEVPVGMAVFSHILFGVAAAMAFLPFQVPRPATKLYPHDAFV